MSEETAAIATELARAEAALRGFAQGPAQRAADEMALAFERAGARMSKAMGAAAQGGETALRGMVKGALEELARLALDRIFSAREPRAQPAPSSGSSASAAAGVNVQFHLPAGSQTSDVRRHDGQIAALVARAVAYGRRNL